MLNSFLIILSSLLFSGFFSGMEIAFVSSNKLHLELMKKRGEGNAKIISSFIDRPSRFIATMLVGNNIALVIYGIEMAKLLEPLFLKYTSIEVLVLLLQTVVSASIVLVTAEFLPKVIFSLNANRFIRIFALPAWFSYYALYIIVTIVMGASKTILKHVMRLKLLDQKPAFVRTDLEQYLQEHTKAYENPNNLTAEIKIFQNALDFSRVKVRECMIPRTEIRAIQINEDISSLRDTFVETGFSKIPVFQENIDQVIGFVHSSELFKNPKEIKSILLPILMVPETMMANEILKLFICERKSIALVLDEFGGTSGLVTVEDVLEEIFGEIEDEHDLLGLEEQQISNREYIFSGRHEVDYLNEKYQLNLPESSDYETLSGLIVKHCQSIPDLGEKIEISGITFHIIEVEQTHIEKVNLFVES